MKRILAIDFGEKRIGLATADASAGLVTARRTILRASDRSAATEIVRFCREEEIGTLLVGLPRSPEGKESAVVFHEETLTSDEALRRLRGRRSRAGVDAEAAAVLLEDWLADHGRESA
ncbi:MAG: hypothetical protein DMF55_09805 [Acidobacteria bacterium]|nr:MAG: hypothetical protein DMF55_09805 [Acidobacteriota bacterium]